jgi:2,6-dihydroxypyridine 3-monooxygenase
MVDESDVSDDIWSFFQGTFTYGLLPDGHIIAYPICQVTSDGEVTGRARINFQWYWNVEEGEALDGLMTAKDGGRRPVTVHFKDLSSTSLDTFRNRALNELVSPFRDLLSAAPNPFVTTISDCEPQNVAFDRVALIGDAAITPRPHAAAGAAKAAADAWRLVDHLLATSGDVQGALRAWEPERLAVGRAYLSKVRAMAAVLQHGGPFPPGAAEFRFGLPPPD